MIYPNECKLCGKPKRGCEYCAACFTEHCRPQSIHLITARTFRDLRKQIRRKLAAGYQRHDLPLSLGEWWVQMMVEV